MLVDLCRSAMLLRPIEDDRECGNSRDVVPGNPQFVGAVAGEMELNAALLGQLCDLCALGQPSRKSILLITDDC